MSIKILCPLTEWQTYTGTRGRGAGREQTARWVVAGDKHCWMIAYESRGSGVVAKSFFGCFEHLIPHAIKTYGLDQDQVVFNICDALGVEIPDTNDLESIGKDIDITGNCHYLRSDDVFERILKTKEEVVE